MATMTLRVGTIKGVRPTLNCDKEVYVLHVPVKFLEEARQLNLDDATLVLVEKLASASSMDEQLQSLKKLMKMVTIHSGSRDMKDAAIDVDFIARLMTTLYVEASPKNPLKCALTRLLLSFPEERHDSVASHLASVLNKLLCPNLNLAEMNSVIVAVNCCFDNFTIGIKAVCLQVLPILNFIDVSLLKYVKELSVHESPTKKMELCQLIHITLRTVLALLQKCQEQIRNLIHDEVKFKGSPLQNNMMVNVIDLFEPQCKILDSSENIRHKESCDKQRFPTIFVLNSLQELVRGIMCFPELPMDTHTNCGIAFVHLTLILRKYGQELNMEINELELPWKIDISTDSSQLSLCTGLLTALTAKELGDHLVIVDRPVIHYIFDQLNSINQRTTANSAMVLAVSRTLLLLSRSARSLEDVSTIESFLPHLLQFVLIHLEHYMDSVRHSATGILQNLVELGSKQQQKCEARKRILSTILEAVKVMPLHRKSKVIGLEILASVMGCQLLIDHIPDLVPNLLSSLADATISTHVTSAIERLMLKHISECPESTWRKMWIEPIKEMLPQASPSLCGPLQDLLAATVKHNPGLITYILDLPTCSGNSKLQLCTFLSCIRLSRKQGALDNESVFVHSPNLWKGILDMRVLEGAMYHHDVELRMSALSLLTESHRSTEVFTMSELHLIKTFLVYNINTEIPSSRQQMLSLMKKVLTRMKNSSLAVHRKMGPKKPKDVNDYGENVLKFYNTFLLWLLDFCFSNLFPGANFGRRVSSLKILSLCYEIISFNSDQPVWTPSPPDVWTLNNCSILLECLKDTYEDNKTMAVNLLVAFPAEALSLNDPSNVRSLVEVCLSLSSSHRPPDCITAAYVLRVLIAFKQTDAAFEAILKNKEPCKVNNTLYLAILVLFNRLKAELYQARKSLLIAASSGPMYGVMFCIKHLLTDVDFRGIAEDCCWRDLMSELVSVCFSVNEVVGPVVNSSSPEGHLPMDFESGKDHLEQRTDCIVSETPILNVTAQMVLLCSWRTVKEVSLFLGELSEKAPIACAEESESGPCILTEKQVLAIGAHLATLLSETKHRGAFEQAYVGFCALCSRLWRHPSARLHILPQQWLQQIMGAITVGKGTKLCATRRSAGVPFMVQALVTTELQVGTNSTCFQNSMTTLLDLADTNEGNDKPETEKFPSTVSLSTASNEFNILGSSDESNDVVSIIEARSHALNILRSLFRNSSLGELVVPYVARGIIVSLKGFKQKTWAERNSATLLYTTLMTRIFGVSRSKETLNIRNRMTGRIFFQRYPSLYDFLLEELKEAVAAMEECNDVLRPALFPVLLLLGRLYPSSLEGTDSNLQLGVYVPYVRRCALSSVLKIRELAARALVPLLAPNQYSSILQEIISTLSHQEYVLQNYTHGLLQQMLNILIEVASTPEIQKEITEEIENWITNLNWMIISPDVCSMTAQVYLHVLTVVSMNLLPTLNPNMWEEICVILRSDLLIEKDLPSSRLVGRRIFCHRTAQLVLYHSLVTCTKTLPPPKFLADIEGLVTQLICHKEYEVAIVALKFLEVLVSQGNDLSEDAEDYTLPIDPEFCIRVHQWNRTHNGVLGEYFRTCSGVGEILLNKVLGPDPYVFQECYQRTFRVLSYCPHIPLLLGRGQEVLKSFLEKCQMECETIGWTILLCAGSLVKAMFDENIAPPPEVCSSLCHALIAFSSVEKSIVCRITVANILLDNMTWLQGSVQYILVLDLCKLWTTVMTLLDDDSEYVRELVSELSLRLNCTKLPVMSQRARELLLDYFYEMMIQKDALMCAVSLVIWCLGTSDFDYMEELAEDRVFDKGEMNIFSETAILIDLVCGYLKKLLCNDGEAKVLNTKLCRSVKMWISEMCWPDADSEEISNECDTLADFVQRAKQNKTLPSSASHALLENKKYSFLMMYTTKKLLDALSSTNVNEL